MQKCPQGPKNQFAMQRFTIPPHTAATSFSSTCHKLSPMKYGVSRNTLFIIAGLVWIIAGCNILHVGISCWLKDEQSLLSKLTEATLVFLFFAVFIFRKLYLKHSRRIAQKSDKNCPFAFFDLKGWGIMAFMITLGMTIRGFHLLPDSFITVFYTGLSLALIITGIRFIAYRKRHL